MGRVEVRVCAARNLCDTQWISKPDPYCKLRLGDKHYKTRIIQNQLNPVWDELFKFQVADCNSAQLIIEVSNDNIVSDDLMGRYALSLSGLRRGVVQDFWCILQGSKTNAEVHLRVLAVDFGAEPLRGDQVLQSLESDRPVPKPPGQAALASSKKHGKTAPPGTNSSSYPIAYAQTPSTTGGSASYVAYPAAPVQQVSWPPPQPQPQPQPYAAPVTYGTPPQGASYPAQPPPPSQPYPPYGVAPPQGAYQPPPPQVYPGYNPSYPQSQTPQPPPQVYPGYNPSYPQSQPPPPAQVYPGVYPGAGGYCAQPTQPPAQVASGVPPIRY